MKRDFKIYISSAIEKIEFKEFESAKEYIQKALLEQMSAPEPFNLLGILEEYKGNFLQACKYYRAAYALDPTYKAARNNLDRITGITYRQALKDIDFGNQQDLSEKENMYYVEYDENRVGHIKSRLNIQNTRELR